MPTYARIPACVMQLLELLVSLELHCLDIWLDELSGIKVNLYLVWQGLAQGGISTKLALLLSTLVICTYVNIIIMYT